MKVLIWFGVFFVFSLIQVGLGLRMGALPTVLYFAAQVALARFLCKQLDKKRAASNPTKHLEAPAQPLRAVMDGEWPCPVCGCVNPEQASACYDCGIQKETALEWLRQYNEKRSKPYVREPRPGDWNCPECGTVLDKEMSRCWKCGFLKKHLTK